MNGEVYLDYAATAPPEPEWLEAGSRTANEFYANPSSPHAAGLRAREALDDARRLVLSSLGGSGNLVFCSGATEANCIALGSLLARQGSPGIAVSAIEHPSVHEAAKALSRRGHPLVLIGSSPDGFVLPEEVFRAMEKRPRMVALMAVNNETGAIQDIAGAVRAIRASPGGSDVRVHVDATQAIGKIPFDPGALGIDSASFSAHKLGGPRGIGALWVRKDTEALWTGGGQESGMRPGTENLAGAASMALAVASATANREAESSRIGSLSRRFLEGASSAGCASIPFRRAPADERYSPWIAQAAIEGVPAEVLVRYLSDKGIFISTGSACSSKRRERRVLDAMGVSEQVSRSAFRVSFGRKTSAADVDALIDALSGARKGLGVA